MEPREVYEWTGCIHEWVSAPLIWLGATLEQEQAYLLHWKTEHLRAERTEGHRLMELEKEAEEERREMKEEELPPPRAQPALCSRTRCSPRPALRLRWSTSPAPTTTTMTPRAAS
ncbi:putative serine/threonine-protein kinase [Hordeum vulgare]|nr:putative serine/threonine-protein kinase [Hordeum vulgare]